MSWASVRGHDHLIDAFRQVVARDRLAHAYLFVGPEGVGKKLFAVELAKALLCEEPTARAKFDACDHCHACLQIAARTHPDFQLVGLPEDKHEFPIALIQEVNRNLSMKPARGGRRVAILDDADDFNDESANAFLKTLEEPPPDSLLILLGASPDRQLPTILSRCQLIRFGVLPAEIVAEQLVSEGIVEKREEALRLARLSGGSLGEARALAEPSVGEFRRALLDGLTQPRIDSVGLAERLVKHVEEASKESAGKRQRAGLVLKFLVEFLRSAILVQQGLDPRLADERDVQAARRLAERVSPDRLLQALDRCLDADYQIDRRLQLTLVLEALLDGVGQKLQAAASR